jgi:tetrahydromethanopterin S-methyltransferase subunit G
MTSQNSTNPDRAVSFGPEDETEQILERAVLRLNRNILGLVLGILTGLIIFIATNFLVLKGGEVVGPHLSLLSQFFIGYSVTFVGSLIGLVYGMVCGYVAGFIIASLYNLVVALKDR